MTVVDVDGPRMRHGVSRPLPLPDAFLPPVAPRAAHAAARDELPCLQHALRTDRGRRASTADSLARGATWLPRMRETFAAAGLPRGLASLPVVESGFRPPALERSGNARGLWQFEVATARGLGLVVSGTRDDRVQPERATDAAARFLARLYARYGDWTLALAAYNAGPQRVDRALARRPGATFWELAARGLLPHASREFVSRFLATVRVADGVATCRVRV